MNTDNTIIAEEIKKKSVIDMALTFTAMIRLFEKRSKSKISKKLYDEFQKINEIKRSDDFYAFHNRFCEWFTNNIKIAERKRKGKIIKASGPSLYGHAAKLLDVTLKVYVYYCALPDKNTSNILLPFLNSAIDNPILGHLKKSFPDEIIYSKTVEQIDVDTYKRLQRLIKTDIKQIFNNNIVPTQYDDIMWYRLNREK